jgi:hypothetical protein
MRELARHSLRVLAKFSHTTEATKCEQRQPGSLKKPPKKTVQSEQFLFL